VQVLDKDGEIAGGRGGPVSLHENAKPGCGPGTGSGSLPDLLAFSPALTSERMSLPLLRIDPWATGRRQPAARLVPRFRQARYSCLPGLRDLAGGVHEPADSCAHIGIIEMTENVATVPGRSYGTRRRESIQVLDLPPLP